MKLLIFTYAPAGLGHLRVTSALVHSCPKEIPYVLLGSGDKYITSIHRFTSVNPIARKVFEAFQYGFLEDVFTDTYVWLLRKNTKEIYLRLIEIINEHPGLDEVTVVATHFGLAHRIGELKSKIKDETNIKINLVVQVTDDTSQHVWCVKGADLTMVPSSVTKKLLSDYAKEKDIPFNCEVSPYPLSPELIGQLSLKEGLRNKAFVRGENDSINVLVPISGAAVGIDYLSDLMSYLDKATSRFRFLIVAKRSSSTKHFLNKISKLRWVELLTGRNDNEVVRIYEKAYVENLIHIEITKPSEQAFKALIPPSKIGGSILLFTHPIGRQEIDNLNFLQRHCLLPLSGNVDLKVYKSGCVPRALRLPDDPKIASELIMWALEYGLFKKMTDKDYKYSVESYMSSELSDRGSWLFWEQLRLLKLI